MLPIIEEVQERIRSNTSGSNSSDSYQNHFNCLEPSSEEGTSAEAEDEKHK